MDDELAAFPGAFAARLDTAAVQLRNPLYQRQADPQPALRAIETALALHEQVEDPRQQLRLEAEPRIAHAEHSLARLAAHAHLDAAGRRRVLDRIGQQICEHLIDARRI